MLLRSTSYRTLQDQASVSAARLSELNEKVKSLQAEHDELLASRLEFEEHHKVIQIDQASAVRLIEIRLKRKPEGKSLRCN
jgi:hypothetical protein